MKENEDNQIEEGQELLTDETYEIQNKKMSKEINLNIYDYKEKKLEKYKLINEEEELLLCKEEFLNEIKKNKENKEEDIKIKELFKGEDDDNFYYLNKNELKKKYLKIETNLDEDSENSKSFIDNQNEKEMEKLYEETILKHPRKIIDGKITKYSFFSWSGFFCCNSPDYISLGETYISYFNTIKLLILIFILISIIHIYPIMYYRKFTSIYNFEDDQLLKTTLGNTIITYFNTTLFFIDDKKKEEEEEEKNTDNSLDTITFDCGENYLFGFIGAVRIYDIEEQYYKEFQKDRIKREFYIEPDFDYFVNKSITNYNNSDSNEPLILSGDYYYSSLNHYLKISDYFYEYKYFNGHFLLSLYHNKTFELRDVYETLPIILNKKDNYHYCNFYFCPKNITDIFYYTCVNDTFNDTFIDYYDDLEYILIVTPLISLVVIIIFYFIYMKAISRDKKDSKKNKIFISNYTLVLHNLKINSDDYNQEIGDLISFLNNTLKSYKDLFKSENEKNDEAYELNIFDISISNVNENKIGLFKKIESLENKIEDIINDNDTIKNKVKNNLRGLYLSMHNIVDNLSASEEKEKKEKKQHDNNLENKKPEIEEDGYDMGKQVKLGKTKSLRDETMNKIITNIFEMHKEYKLKNYTDIYITFRNQIIPIFIYQMFNKSKISRFFYYFFCQKDKTKKYYYKNQWLNFQLAKENPSDVKWENCYIATGKKCGRRFLSVLISIIFIVVITVIMVYLNLEENKSYEYIIIVLTQIISIGSTYVLKKFTELEKYSSKSKDIFSVIKKYFWLNFFVSVTIFCKKNNYFIFTYIKMENYYILNKVIIMNMFYSIFTSHLSYLFSFILNFVKRFGDSKYDNGKTTKLNNKIKYEKLYLGPDFPFEERYAKILVNLSICLVYGTNCPIIYFFFVLFLIATFLIDKFLMINFYKKPPLYGGIIAKKMKSYFYFCVFLYIYGVFYNVSTPYLFKNDLLKDKFKHWNRYNLETTFSIIILILIY